MAQNNDLLDKSVRYGEALLLGDGFILGGELFKDIRQKKKINSLEDVFYNQKDYRKAFELSESILKEECLNENIIKNVNWINPKSVIRK